MGTTAKRAERAMQTTHALGLPSSSLGNNDVKEKKKHKASPPKASEKKKGKRSPNFTRKAQKCNKD